jgi:hypothetical protein
VLIRSWVRLAGFVFFGLAKKGVASSSWDFTGPRPLAAKTFHQSSAKQRKSKSRAKARKGSHGRASLLAHLPAYQAYLPSLVACLRPSHLLLLADPPPK